MKYRIGGEQSNASSVNSQSLPRSCVIISLLKAERTILSEFSLMISTYMYTDANISQRGVVQNTTLKIAAPCMICNHPRLSSRATPQALDNLLKFVHCWDSGIFYCTLGMIMIQYWCCWQVNDILQFFSFLHLASIPTHNIHLVLNDPEAIQLVTSSLLQNACFLLKAALSPTHLNHTP